MGSTRLPGKVLKEVLGRPLLAYMIERVKQAKKVDEIIVATTHLAQDQPIIDLCNELNIPTFRGENQDVLSRFLEVADRHDLNVVIRLTADCPLIDPQVIDAAISLFEEGGVDYVTNALERTYPKGMDVEVFSREALEIMKEKAKDPYEKEHVTPYLYQGKEIFRHRHLKREEDRSSLRLTVDTLDDFTFVKHIIETLYPVKPSFTLEDILSIC